MSTPRPVRPGVEWARPDSSAPDGTVQGNDAALAACVAQLRQHFDVPLVGWEPSSDAQLARALGLVPGAVSTGRSVLLDAMEVVGTLGESATLAVNIVVVGTPPGRVRSWHRSALRVGDDRAWGVVVASGQFHEGVDVVPRGHPGDGRLEVQVYDVVAAQRAALRRRLRTGTHVPHPSIRQTTVTSARVEARHPVGVEADGRVLGRSPAVEVRVVPGAFRLAI